MGSIKKSGHPCSKAGNLFNSPRGRILSFFFQLVLTSLFLGCGFDKPKSIPFFFQLPSEEGTPEQPILSTGNELSNILPSLGTLYPPFSPTTSSYTLTLSNGTGSVQITPTASDTEASITVNGMSVNSGSTSPSIALQSGQNTITIIVRAQNGTERTYTVLANVVSDYLAKVNLTGLSGEIRVRCNSDELSLNTDGVFAFPSSLPNASNYAVEILSKPNTQFCAITTSPNNNLPYGTISNADVILGIECKNGYLYNGTIYQTYPVPTIPSLNQLSTMAGSFPTRESGFVDDVGFAARFDNPIAIATDGTHIYVADIFNSRVRKLNISTREVSTLATSPGPHGIATDGIYVYVTSHSNHIINRIPVGGGTAFTIAGSVSGNTDGVGTLARFNVPTYLTTDGVNVYITDRGNDQIRKYSIATGEVTTLVTGLSDPNGITTDGDYLYIANTSANNILKYDLKLGGPSTIFAGGLTSPYGLTMDGENLYVFEGTGKSIKKIVLSSGTISTLISSVGYQDGLLSGAAQICSTLSPCDSSLTTDGNFLYISDRHNHSIRKIGP